MVASRLSAMLGFGPISFSAVVKIDAQLTPRGEESWGKNRCCRKCTSKLQRDSNVGCSFPSFGESQGLLPKIQPLLQSPDSYDLTLDSENCNFKSTSSICSSLILSSLDATSRASLSRLSLELSLQHLRLHCQIVIDLFCSVAFLAPNFRTRSPVPSTSASRPPPLLFCHVSGI